MNEEQVPVTSESDGHLLRMCKSYGHVEKRDLSEMYTALTAFRQLTIDDKLDGGDVIPGFSYPLRWLFR